MIRQSLLLFVGGPPRSGTTLFQKILDLHSRVSAGPEFDHLPSLMRLYAIMKSGIENGRQSFYYDLSELRNSYKSLILEILTGRRGYPLVISEKTPNNVFVFEELFEIFPEAKFILIVRDPRAILNSFKMVQRKARQNGDYTNVPIGRNLYKDINSVYHSISRGIDFVKKHQAQSKLVYYEDIVHTPEKTIRDVCEFIGISFELGMLETHRRNEMSILAEKKQSTELPYISDLFDKGISNASAEAWRQSLSLFEQSVIEDFFNRNQIECLKRYPFEKRGFWLKTRVFLYRCNNFTKRLIMKTLKRFLKNL